MVKTQSDKCPPATSPGDPSTAPRVTCEEPQAEPRGQSFTLSRCTVFTMSLFTASGLFHLLVVNVTFGVGLTPPYSDQCLFIPDSESHRDSSGFDLPYPSSPASRTPFVRRIKIEGATTNGNTLLGVLERLVSSHTIDNPSITFNYRSASLSLASSIPRDEAYCPPADSFSL